MLEEPDFFLREHSNAGLTNDWNTRTQKKEGRYAIAYYEHESKILDHIRRPKACTKARAHTVLSPFSRQKKIMYVQTDLRIGPGQKQGRICRVLHFDGGNTGTMQKCNLHCLAIAFFWCKGVPLMRLHKNTHSATSS